MSQSNEFNENGCADYLNHLLDEDDKKLNDVFTFETSSIGEQIKSSTDQNETKKPKVLIMGLRRSGKSSIQKVVFHKMNPTETFFLESTNKIIRDDIKTNSIFLFFSIYTLPGELVVNSKEVTDLLNSCSALVFVIDAQDDNYSEAMSILNFTIIKAYKLNPNIKFEIFIHKIDCLSDDNRIELQRDVRQRVIDDLSDQEFGSIQLSFHLTSIYDHSIFEAFSKVIQKLIPQLPILESLLNLFISTCQIEKAYLFDVVSKIYLATDSAAVDMQSYELLCDMIDVVIDISGIYGTKDENEFATFDGCSSSVIKLNNSTVLYLREVNNFLALVCILSEENFDRQGLIDYNFQCFKDAISEIFNCKKGELVNQPLTNGEQYFTENSLKSSIKEDKLTNNESSLKKNQ